MDVFDAVHDLHVHARVVELAGDVRQVLFGHFDDATVDFRQYRFFHGRVLQRLTDRAAVTAADDEHALRVRVGVQCDMRDHLMVDKLVFVGGHDHAVQHEHFAPLQRLDQVKRLKFRLLGVQRFRDLCGDAVIFGLFFCVPEFHV